MHTDAFASCVPVPHFVQNDGVSQNIGGGVKERPHFSVRPVP